jgi:hypothetical protein
MCQMSWKSGILNLLEPSGLHRPCNGTTLLYLYHYNDCEDCSLLGCDTMWCVRCMLTYMDTRWWRKQHVPQKCQYSSTNIYIISQHNHVTLSFCNWCRFTFTHVICVCFSLLRSPLTSDTIQTVYIKSHTRASPYFVGIALGYLLHHLRDYKQKVGVVSVSSVLLIPCKR